MSDLKTKYTTKADLVFTLTSLAYQAYRQSTVIDNTTNLFLDVLVTVKVKSNASGTSGSGSVQIFAYGTTDDGTTYDSGCTGTDGAFTPDCTPPNLAYLGTINLTANAKTQARTFSLAQAFGGVIPKKWGLVAYNNTLQTLDASVGSAWYQGIYAQTV